MASLVILERFGKLGFHEFDIIILDIKTNAGTVVFVDVLNILDFISSVY